MIINVALQLKPSCNNAKASPSSYNMIESQSVNYYRMIMMCGATMKMSDKIELYVLDLQISALTSYSHHIVTLSQTLIIKNVSNT